MQVQIYYLKKTFEVQKAERWFKERRVQVQWVDLAKARLGQRELANIAAQTGLDALIDKESNAWLESTARFIHGKDLLLEELSKNLKFLRTPIVRCGKRATVGYAPETWEAWMEEG